MNGTVNSTINQAYLDAFGRQRFSLPKSLFDSQFQYDLNPRLWYDVPVGAGSVSTHLPYESSIGMTITTVSGRKLTRQSKEYFRYRPGKSHLLIASVLFADAKNNLAQRVGLLDNNNGVFFQLSGTVIQVAIRSKVTGTVVDYTVNQADWVIDKLNGLGGDDNPSGIDLDLTAPQILVMDLQWLNAGRVRFGFCIGGAFVYCHEINHANVTGLTSGYMTTANLPIRYEIENIDTTASNSTMKQICCVIMTECGDTPEELSYYGSTASRGVSGVTVANGTLTFMLAVRMRTSINSITNRGYTIPYLLDIHTGSSEINFQLLLNPTITAGTWSNVSTANSILEMNTTATGFSGGDVISDGLIDNASTGRFSSDNLAALGRIKMYNSFDGTTGAILCLVGQGSGGTSVCKAVLGFKEYW